MRLLTCEEMKTVELYASQSGMSYALMMENAGTACTNQILRFIASDNLQISSFTVVCGKGNNGGDGFVIARKLTEKGYNVSIVMTSGYPNSKEAEMMYKMAVDMSVPVYWYDGDKNKTLQQIRMSECIVDCVFGFSFHGNVRDDISSLFDEINATSAYIFSVDLPSGVNCDNGMTDEHCLIADYTIAISALKPCHIVHPACDCCGKIAIAGIGIPNQCFRMVRNSLYSLSKEEIPNLLPQRKEVSNKGDYGHLLVIAGSYKMPGACAMATSAALRSGAGLVTCAFPESLHTVMSLKLTEALLLPLPQNENGNISKEAIEIITENIDKYSAVVIGPGLGVCEDTAELVKNIITKVNKPLVLDADALNVIADEPEILKQAKAPVVITPHPGEMSRLLSCSVQQIQLSRLKIANTVAKKLGVNVVLKGSSTVVASPSSDSTYINQTGNNALAKGGSGDVLTGIIGSLIAQGVSPLTASILGVYIHGYCADVLCENNSPMGILPTDIINALPQILNFN